MSALPTVGVSVLEKLFSAIPADQQGMLLTRVLTALQAAPQAGGPIVWSPATAVPYLKNLSGLDSSSGDTILLPAVGDRRYNVLAYCLSTVSSAVVTALFINAGAGQKEVWRGILQAPSNVSNSIALSVPYPCYLFQTDRNASLVLNLSAAVAVHYSLTYWESQ